MYTHVFSYYRMCFLTTECVLLHTSGRTAHGDWVPGGDSAMLRCCACKHAAAAAAAPGASMLPTLVFPSAAHELEYQALNVHEKV